MMTLIYIAARAVFIAVSMVCLGHIIGSWIRKRRRDRTSEMYAIEFEEYLAKAAEEYQRVVNDPHRHQDDMSDAHRGLSVAIYGFRARVMRVAVSA